VDRSKELHIQISPLGANTAYSIVQILRRLLPLMDRAILTGPNISNQRDRPDGSGQVATIVMTRTTARSFTGTIFRARVALLQGTTEPKDSGPTLNSASRERAANRTRPQGNGPFPLFLNRRQEKDARQR
jgi:hypothetical protein